MEKIRIDIGERKKAYDIIIAEDSLAIVEGHIKKNHPKKAVVIITDDNVKKLYIKKIEAAFAAVSPLIISVPPGEQSKSREEKARIEDEMLSKGIGRNTVVVALGGGVVGDLAGFVASTYNRGVPVIQVPTTLLSMADSSVGGKTGINTKHGKNLIGTFFQPELVVIDPSFLKTLPEEEYLNGMCEIIKAALIRDSELFQSIEMNASLILKRDKETVMEILKKSILIKKEAVEKDEKEAGLRQTLNFGHTIGHAVEACSGYSIRHGYAVSIGMAAEARISSRIAGLKEEEKEKIILLLKKLSLPVNIPAGLSTDALKGSMSKDKKNTGKNPRFVLLEKIGKVKKEGSSYSSEVEDKIIGEEIKKSR